MHQTTSVSVASVGVAPSPTILICMFGSFRVLRDGEPVPMRSGGKAEALLSFLALRQNVPASRDAVLDALWPERDPVLSAQTLSSLVYSLHKAIGAGPQRLPPVLQTDSHYQLNTEAGVDVDITLFDSLVEEAERESRIGHEARSVAVYERAVELYSGDLVTGPDLHDVLERERLRAQYLTLLARLADHYFAVGDYTLCRRYALRLLAVDPCREDAHRFVMLCHVRLGERAQALRQYRVCVDMLNAEFNAEPELSTAALFEQIRCDPANV